MNDKRLEEVITHIKSFISDIQAVDDSVTIVLAVETEDFLKTNFVAGNRHNNIAKLTALFLARIKTYDTQDILDDPLLAELIADHNENKD